MSYGGELGLKLAGDRWYELNDWSFRQVCRMSGVRKETINHLKVETAAQVLSETFPTSQRPFQVLTHQGHVRSIQAESFSGPSNASLLEVIIDEAYDYAPPLKALGGVSGLYAGEQDMFAFLIDNEAVIEIDGERFTPGFVLWNSEVGRCRFGIHAYWHQHSCSNHIIWDPNAAMGFQCKRRVSVAGAIEQFRQALRHLLASQNVRRDRFAESVKSASKTSLGPSLSDIFKVLTAQGIGRAYVREAIEVMDRNNSLSIFNAIDYLTQVTRQIVNAGDRVDQEMKVGSLLSLALSVG